MEVCLTTDAMMTFVDLLWEIPDVVAIYQDSYQIDVGPMSYIYDATKELWCGYK
jgi:hypothetical protein